jgi:NAD(P)-dependent dehydrogenase (short-subunit alcohol dehydrogenase family)
MSFEDSHIVIVGGSSGVGLALAQRLHADGSRLTLLGRDKSKLDRAVAGMRGAHSIRLDLRSPEGITPAVGGIDAVDHLVVTAGTLLAGSLAESNIADWRTVFDERVIGPLALIQALAPRIRHSIVLFSGTVVRRPGPSLSVLAAAVGAVESLVRSLAVELAPRRVNAVAPGMLDTPMLDGVLTSSSKAEVCQAAAARLPVRRVGSAMDAAEAALFFMQNSYVTGVTLEVDGGAHLI